MSSNLMNTPDASSRDSSTVSSPPLNNSQQAQMATPNSKNINNNMLAIAGTPPSPRASDTSIIVPRRIFVGGFPPSTTEHELRAYFEHFGNVRDVKIIRDHAATAKGKYSYGFVTFESDDEAKKLIAMGKADGARAFEFRGRYLNVNEAVKKPPFNKMLPLDAVPPTGVVLRDVNGQLFTIQNGYAIIASPDSYAIAQPQAPTPTFPFVVQHPVYLASTAPPAPLKYAHQPAAAFGHVQPSPASAPVFSQHPGSATHIPKTRFVFPPLPPVGQQPFNGNQLTHLPPTPVASPVNPESPSKNMMVSFTGNNPAITNLTNPFPSVMGGNQQVPMPPSPYRWTTSTIAGPVTQLVYPGSYPTFVHDVNHPYPMHPQGPPPVGAGMLPGFYTPDGGDYSSFSALEPSHEFPPLMDRRQSKNTYRMDASASIMKE